MHPILFFTVVLLSVMFAITWHDEPARQKHHSQESLSKPPTVQPPYDN